MGKIYGGMDLMQSRKNKFDFISGQAIKPKVESIKRFAKNVSGIFYNQEAMDGILKQGNPLIYEFYDLGIEEKVGNLAYGTSLVHPGTVGDEFYMTKGHFHTILETSEIYLCIKGHGLMLMENPEGEIEIQEMTPGEAVFVPGRYAHRSINISDDEPLITFFTFPADAGHDYKTIELKGFRKLVVRSNKEKYKVIDNPRWKNYVSPAPSVKENSSLKINQSL